jgi:hypothetical protein
LLDASRAYDLTSNAVPRPHPRQALLFFDVRIVLVDPHGRGDDLHQGQPRRRSQRVPACIGARMCDTTAVCSAYTSVPPSHTPLSSPPAHGHHLRHYHTLPLDACPSHAPSAPPFGRRRAPPRARSTLLPPFPIVAVVLIATRHTTAVFRRILPSVLGACVWTHPRPDLHQCPALARLAVPPRGRATRCLCARCDVLGTLPL